MANKVGMYPEGNLISLVAYAEYGTSAWNEKLRVTFPGNGNVKIYKMKDLRQDANNAANVPYGSTVEFLESWQHRFFVKPMKDFYLYLALGVGIGIALNR